MRDSVKCLQLVNRDECERSVCFVCICDCVLYEAYIVVNSTTWDACSLVSVNNEREYCSETFRECFSEDFVICIQ